MRKYSIQRTLLALSIAACLVPTYAQSQSAGSGSSSGSAGSSASSTPEGSSSSSMRDSHSGSGATGSTMGSTSSSTGSDTHSQSGSMESSSRDPMSPSSSSRTTTPPPGTLGSEMGKSTSPSMGSSSSTSPSTVDASGTVAKDQGLTESDRSLNISIRSAFNSDPLLRDTTRGVNLNTDNGVVTLNGIVSTEKEKADLESRIKSMSGVSQVENNLQIVSRTGSTSPSSTTAPR